MVPCSFEESNTFLSAPPGMEETLGCQSVAVGPTFAPDGSPGPPIVVSCWKFTEADWKAVQETGRVWLIVLGTTMPPVILSGIKPNMEVALPGSAEAPPEYDPEDYG